MVLASGSPRRKELLQQLVTEFEVVPADIDESVYCEDDPPQTAMRLARDKALAVYAQRPDHLVIGGDTVVAFEAEPGQWVKLEKPLDAADAMRMLGLLSGRDHWVLTGIAVRSPRGLANATERTLVRFRALSAGEIEDYVASGEPMDKAGAYGIQGGAAKFLERMEGPLDNVIGLPCELLLEKLKDLG